MLKSVTNSTESLRVSVRTAIAVRVAIGVSGITAAISEIVKAAHEIVLRLGRDSREEQESKESDKSD